MSKDKIFIQTPPYTLELWFIEVSTGLPVHVEI